MRLTARQCFPRHPACSALLAFGALLASACAINPSTGPFSCRAGSPCPPGQVCGPDLLCVDPLASGMIAPDAGAAADGGGAGSVVEAGTASPDGDVPMGGAGRDGNVGGTNPNASGGSAAMVACEPACTGALPVCDRGVCVECIAGAGRCEGDRPFRCSDERRWRALDLCGGDTPACSNGECAAVRGVGGIVTLGPQPMSEPGMVLVDQALVAMPPLCGDVRGSRICVYGAIVP